MSQVFPVVQHNWRRGQVPMIRFSSESFVGKVRRKSAPPLIPIPPLPKTDQARERSWVSRVWMGVEEAADLLTRVEKYMEKLLLLLLLHWRHTFRHWSLQPTLPHLLGRITHFTTFDFLQSSTLSLIAVRFLTSKTSLSRDRIWNLSDISNEKGFNSSAMFNLSLV